MQGELPSCASVRLFSATVSFSPRTFSLRPLLSFPVFLHFGVRARACVCVSAGRVRRGVSLQPSFLRSSLSTFLPSKAYSLLSVFCKSNPRLGGCSSPIVCSRIPYVPTAFSLFLSLSVAVTTCNRGPQTGKPKNVPRRLARLTIRGLERLAG